MSSSDLDTLLTSGYGYTPSTGSASSVNLGQVGFGMQAFGALYGAVGAFYSAQQQSSALKFQADMAEINARVAERSAQSAMLAGQRQAGQLTLKAGQMKSAQRAAMAANGIDIGVGNAAEIQASTDLMKEIDKNTIEANSIMAAFGYRTQAVNMQNDALIKRATAGNISPAGAAFGSMLGSAGGVASNWYMLNKAGAFNSPSNR